MDFSHANPSFCARSRCSHAGHGPPLLLHPRSSAGACWPWRYHALPLVSVYREDGRMLLKLVNCWESVALCSCLGYVPPSNVVLQLHEESGGDAILVCWKAGSGLLARLQFSHRATENLGLVEVPQRRCRSACRAAAPIEVHIIAAARRCDGHGCHCASHFLAFLPARTRRHGAPVGAESPSHLALTRAAVCGPATGALSRCLDSMSRSPRSRLSRTPYLI
jgi:hypothetical protein